MASLVKRKIGGLVGVVMNSSPADASQRGLICEVAFGYMTKADATKDRKHGKAWPEVYSDHLELLNDMFFLKQNS